MPNLLPSTARGLTVLALVVAVVCGSIGSASAFGAEPRLNPDVDPETELPQALALLAPFTCGTTWQATTYPGHGAHNWNADLNQANGTGRADLGQPILAQADGTVVWFKEYGYNNRAGTYIEIDYGDVTVRYIHLVEGSIPSGLAEIGSRVRTGDLIGLLGDTGRVTAPHLHLEYWDSAGYDDTAWYQLPRGNQLPIAFAGQSMVATPSHPSEVAVSTNCPAPWRPAEAVGGAWAVDGVAGTSPRRSGWQLE
ncbi:MAG: M23 family metallopeptidase [Acidimicrobiales bacterium]